MKLTPKQNHSTLQQHTTIPRLTLSARVAVYGYGRWIFFKQADLEIEIEIDVWEKKN
jgi:hypothetical protein